MYKHADRVIPQCIKTEKWPYKKGNWIQIWLHRWSSSLTPSCYLPLAWLCTSSSSLTVAAQETPESRNSTGRRINNMAPPGVILSWSRMEAKVRLMWFQPQSPALVVSAAAHVDPDVSAVCPSWKRRTARSETAINKLEGLFLNETNGFYNILLCQSVTAHSFPLALPCTKRTEVHTAVQTRALDPLKTGDALKAAGEMILVILATHSSLKLCQSNPKVTSSGAGIMSGAQVCDQLKPASYPPALCPGVLRDCPGWYPRPLALTLDWNKAEDRVQIQEGTNPERARARGGVGERPRAHVRVRSAVEVGDRARGCADCGARALTVEGKRRLAPRPPERALEERTGEWRMRQRQVHSALLRFNTTGSRGLLLLLLLLFHVDWQWGHSLITGSWDHYVLL